jgi:hypothetical protein
MKISLNILNHYQKLADEAKATHHPYARSYEQVVENMQENIERKYGVEPVQNKKTHVWGAPRRKGS